MRQVSILVVDDNPKNRGIVEELFRDECQVYHAEDGPSALAFLRTQTPDLILLDIMMPEMSGYEVCQRIKTNPESSDIPVIIISAKGRTEEIIEGFESRADDYIVRPFVNSELRARVRATLRLKQAQDQLKEANRVLQEQTEKLLDANERLKELDRLKAGFTAMLVHDLRSPLAVIQVALQMLEGKVEMLGPEYPLLVREAIVSCQGIFSLTTDVLEGFRAESGAMSLSCRIARIREILDEPFRHCSVLALKKHIEVDFLVPSDLPEISIDVPKMQRAVANLLGNAIKFTRKNGRVGLGVRLEARAGNELPGGRDLIISVCDSGEGVSAEDLPYVFDPYYQGRTKSTGLGSGLGLSIAKRVVEAHGGRICVQTTPGMGSSFTIVLPLEKVGKPSGGSAAPNL